MRRIKDYMLHVLIYMKNFKRQIYEEEESIPTFAWARTMGERWRHIGVVHGYKMTPGNFWGQHNCIRTRWWRSLHNLLNFLKIIELCILDEWIFLRYVNYTLTQLFETIITKPKALIWSCLPKKVYNERYSVAERLMHNMFKRRS